MRVLIASGGSGGHIFPAVAVARSLFKNGADVIFIASKRALDKKILENERYKKNYLSINPMPYKFDLGIFVFLVRVVIDSTHSLCLLLRYRPDVVVGFGGYTSGCVVLLSALLNIKTIIHEQNLIPGRTNRILDRFVDKIAISFNETKEYFKNRNVIFSGNPLREESLIECRKSALGNLKLDESKVTILIMGGSQGASALNDLASKSIVLLPNEKKKSLQVIHITGPRDRNKVNAFYVQHGIVASVSAYVEKINEAYSACDIAISRAGAAALFELAAFGRPMILIPYPYRKNNQRFNARFFAEKGAAIYVDEAALRAEELKDLVVELIDNPDKKRHLSDNARKLSLTDGAQRLKEQIEHLRT